jgi:hypothetical protein
MRAAYDNQMRQIDAGQVIRVPAVTGDQPRVLAAVNLRSNHLGDRHLFASRRDRRPRRRLRGAAAHRLGALHEGRIDKLEDVLRDGRHVVVPAKGGVDIVRLTEWLNHLDARDVGGFQALDLGDVRIAVRLCDLVGLVNESEPARVEIRTSAAPKTMRVTRRDAAGLLAEAEVSP